METNLLVAISHLVSNPITSIGEHYRSTNRMNRVGDALEIYIKDLFCGSYLEEDSNQINQIYSKYFSYTGNQNNPPDIMIRGGDAIEVKKINNPHSTIALNSSYPKALLSRDDPMLTSGCRNCEEWQEKDLIYTIGAVNNNNKLTSLWFVYGNCYAASKDVYEKKFNLISKGINEIPDISTSTTNELARLNRVDPLGITYLRVRGMWGIEHPNRVFSYLLPNEIDADFKMNAIILKQKYDEFPKNDKEGLEDMVGPNLHMKDVKIKSPDNPASLLDAILISYWKKI